MIARRTGEEIEDPAEIDLVKDWIAATASAAVTVNDPVERDRAPGSAQPVAPVRGPPAW